MTEQFAALGTINKLIKAIKVAIRVTQDAGESKKVEF
jgi:hypothetical protein